jgi:hypothetical protein
MDFTIEQRLAGSPHAVIDTLLDPAFAVARAALPKLGGAELLDLHRDGKTAHQRVRMRFTGDLAPAVTAVIDPERLTWVDDAEYDLEAHEARHTIEPDHYADRLSCSYTATVTPADTGSRRVLRGVLRVRMPLVGGRVERAIVSGLGDYAGAEAELLDTWVAR